MDDLLAVKGAEQFTSLATRLKLVADVELKREFSRSITQAMKPLIAKTRQSARQRLPKRGGLAERTSRVKIRTTRRTVGPSAGVRLIASGGVQADKGYVRHPVFAARDSKKPWVGQKVTPGWWSQPLSEGIRDVQIEMSAAMRRVANKIGD